jgi:hypothetical protein
MLGASTPVSRIRLERFGKSSVALARCQAGEGGPVPDQSAYEPLFHSASELLANYRRLLNVKAIVPAELAKAREAPKAVSTQKKSAAGTSKMRKTVPPPK